MQPDRSGRPYPDAAEFAAHVASLYGLRRIVDAGSSWDGELSIAYPKLTPIRLDAGEGDRPITEAARTAVLAAGPADSLLRSGGALPALGSVVTESPFIVIATDESEPAVEWLAGHNLAPTFQGRTRSAEDDTERSGRLIVVDRALDRATSAAGEPPAGFRVVAIMAVYNEEDVIGPSIAKMVEDGVGVYVIDNWSTDRTYEIARSFEGRGLVGLERYPAASTNTFVLRALLARTTAVAAGLDADWVINHDADERRCGPWPGVGLREALWRVDRAGFNAVDFTVVNYRPIDDSFEPETDFERHFRHFEFGDTSDLLLQIKAYKNVGHVDLVGSAGHQATFPGRRVFPYKFLLKHYPIRSQAHGEQKIFRDRVPRWDRHERARGWHVHYDDLGARPSFLPDPSGLIEDRGDETWSRYLPEALTGAGLIHRELPDWALGGGAGRRFYLGKQAVERSAFAALVRNAAGKPRGLAKRVRNAFAARG